MLRFALVLSLLFVAVNAPARADQNDPRLVRLFAQLAQAKTPPEANGVEQEIVTLWSRSGSDTADVLMTRARQAIDAQDAGTAKRLYDSVTEMRPAFAQAWYERAALLVAMDSPQEAASDLEKAIALEPRHYLALELLGKLTLDSGDKKGALALFRKAIAANPTLEALKRRVAGLTAEVEGKDI